MQTRRSTRSSVLGKRPHAPDAPSSSAPASPVSSASTSTTTSFCEPPPTPEATPSFKRARTSLTLLEGDWNKENVAPSPCGEVVPSSPRTLRRAASDFERTPTRARTAPARHASTSDLLTALATPPPTPAPSALLPLHARARALLRATTTTASPADCLAGRDAERAAIRAFLSDDADENGGEGEETNNGVLYISGAPGSGKTALVTALLAETPARAVFVNCMALDGPDALWARLLEELGPAKTGKRGRKPAKEPAGKEGVAQALRALAAASSSTPVLVLDELDAVPPPTLGALFALPAGAPVRLVGIANTHTLAAAAPAEGVRTLHFAPYTPAQLLAILHARLAPLSLSPSPSGHADALKELFAPPTLGLLTKKVAAQTGDVRVLFSVLRGALELAAAAATPTTSTSTPTKADVGEEEENPLNTPAPRVTVTPAHVLAALKTHAASSPPARTAASTSGASSATVESVRALGLHAQLALLALLIAARRLAAGLPLAGPLPSPARTPVSTPKKPRSPTKRTVSSPQCSTLSSSTSTSGGGGGGIETGALHAFYAGLLARSDAFAPVSRSELGDVLGVLEGAGLVALAAPAPSTSRSPRKLGRTASFGGAKSLGTGGAVSVAAGVRAEELLRGLGIVLGPDGSAEAAPGRGVREEEVCAIWERERARLAREVKASETALRLAGAGAGRGEVFGDAMED
ncbi:hypothetical protein HWV62_18958 [Athelia sp. TMB]|nr:hypothetical protein HWV62_18958 [Athelia sp. TMB]